MFGLLTSVLINVTSAPAQEAQVPADARATIAAANAAWLPALRAHDAAAIAALAEACGRTLADHQESLAPRLTQRSLSIAATRQN